VRVWDRGDGNGQEKEKQKGVGGDGDGDSRGRVVSLESLKSEPELAVWRHRKPGKGDRSKHQWHQRKNSPRRGRPSSPG
jgi:hypothetical protein